MISKVFPFRSWDELFCSVLIGNWYEVEGSKEVIVSGGGNVNR